MNFAIKVKQIRIVFDCENVKHEAPRSVVLVFWLVKKMAKLVKESKPCVTVRDVDIILKYYKIILKEEFYTVATDLGFVHKWHHAILKIFDPLSPIVTHFIAGA